MDARTLFPDWPGRTRSKSAISMQSQYNDVLNGYQGAIVDLWWGQSYVAANQRLGLRHRKESKRCAIRIGRQQLSGALWLLPGGRTSHHQYRIDHTIRARVLHSGCLAGGQGINAEPGRALQPGEPAGVRSQSLPQRWISAWDKKIAPRIGGAYDLLHNGKVKIFASYGQFYDTMKMGLARGSFGSDYWHQCVYALDTTNFNSITTDATSAAMAAARPAVRRRA